MPHLMRCKTTAASPKRALSGSIGGGPLPAYQAKVKSGLIKEDPHQLTALEPLQRLYEEVMDNPGGPAVVVAR